MGAAARLQVQKRGMRARLELASSLSIWGQIWACYWWLGPAWHASRVISIMFGFWRVKISFRSVVVAPSGAQIFDRAVLGAPLSV